MYRYRIDPNSNVPIYRQLVNQINAQIRSGALKTGTQLPTVREMADRLGLSCGTIKHVYDTLQEMGDIEMTRRRGTFVKYVRRDTDSRKQQAMYAIDHMIRKLSELNFSPAEIQIFLNLKMREWGLKWSGVRIAVITDCPEAERTLTRQLEQIGNVQVTLCAMSRLREYPYNIDEQNDVILASPQDAQELSLLLPDSDKVIRVAFSADAAPLAACRAESVGILCESDFFERVVRRALPHASRLTGSEQPEAIVTFEGAEIPDFPGEVIRLSYGLDEGSLIGLRERIVKIRDEHQQWPGAMRN